MGRTLYLVETRAQRDYVCPACKGLIRRGTMHFRHDPYPYAKWLRKEETTHWCRDCILSSAPGDRDFITHRLRVPIVRVYRNDQPDLPLFAPVRVEWIGIGKRLSKELSADPRLIYQLSPDEFERFICDRLEAMGLEPRRVGAMNRKDGGVDILFWPRFPTSFPFLGAAQVKHHRSPQARESPSTVRDFVGSIAGRPFNAGLLVTSTSFTPDAEWYAREYAKLVRLRDFADIRRWLANNFTDEAEWREIPEIIELCPGVTVRIR